MQDSDSINTIENHCQIKIEIKIKEELIGYNIYKNQPLELGVEIL